MWTGSPLPGKFMAYGLAVAGVGLAAGVRGLLDPLLGNEYPFVTFMVAVVLLAWYGGLGPGLLTTGLGMSVGSVLFLPPRGTLELRGFSDQVGIGLYSFIGIALSLLIHAQRTARARAQARQRDLETEMAQRARAEEARQLSEQSFRQLADTMPQIVWITGPDGTFEYFNRRWYEYVGRDDVAAGRGWDWALHPEDRDAVLSGWKESLVNGRPYQTERRFRRKDGTYRWFLGRALPVHDAAGRIVKWFGTCTDIDDQKRTEQVMLRYQIELEERVHERTAALEATNTALERSNRELQEFASVASHDLQEPLRKIQAFGDRMRMRCAEGLGEQGRDFLGRMQHAAGRMSTLINDLLAFSRVTTKAQPFQPVNLKRVATEVLADLEVRVQQSGGTVEIGELPTIDADPLQMRQLLQNLIGNALKFHRPDVSPRVHLGARLVDGASCELSVADNGIGFDEKYLDRIFNVFQRLHGRDQFDGTGMGLAIVRKITERHGGRITARSEPGQGSTFLVTLPLRHPEEPQRDHEPG